ncbi:MAG: pyridoxal-phosphate-dependent aminotransferase family protein [Tepidanaerobacteraceae bacterium]|jgi:alanine-glyoxylate transaminase/serine-glyoxylate transaminase/serine-pyruvate transaminase
MNKKLLMIPGPCDIEEDVLLEMSKQVVAHYGEDWVEVYNETRNLLKRLLNTTGEVFIANGSGHLAIEAMLTALGEKGEEIALVENGHFSHRMVELLESYRLKPKIMPVEWGHIATPEQVENFLKQNNDVKSLVVVHSETSTGALNPIKEIAEVAKKMDVLFAVDAVSSVGVVPIDMEDWGIDFCATASQKGLGTPPGLAILAVSNRALDFVRSRKKPIPGWYANLEVWDRFNTEGKEFQPFYISLAVSIVVALKKSLENIFKEGLENRYERHRKISKLMKEGVRACGLTTVSKDSECTPAITVIRFPYGMDSGEFVSYLSDEYNIQVANGLGPFKGKTVRVGHMGKNATKNNVLQVLFGLESFLRKKNNDLNVGLSLRQID